MTSGADARYGGSVLGVSKVTAVYNRILISNFINAYKIMIHRYILLPPSTLPTCTSLNPPSLKDPFSCFVLASLLVLMKNKVHLVRFFPTHTRDFWFSSNHFVLRYKTGKDTFFGKAWKARAGAEDKEWRYDKYTELVHKYDWNKEHEWGTDVPILPACHGTESTIAEKICETGFASLSSLDAGWYVPSPFLFFCLRFSDSSYLELFCWSSAEQEWEESNRFCILIFFCVLGMERGSTLHPMLGILSHTLPVEDNLQSYYVGFSLVILSLYLNIIKEMTV